MQTPITPPERRYGMPLSVTTIDNIIVQNGLLPIHFGRCGLFFCRAGQIDLTIDDMPYHIAKGDVVFYLPSVAIRVTTCHTPVNAIVADVDMDYILPLSGLVLDVENIITLLNHPHMHLSTEQYTEIEELLNLFIRKTLTTTTKTGQQTNLQRIKREMFKAGGAVIFFRIMELYFSNSAPPPRRLTQKDTIYRRFVADLFHYFHLRRDVRFYAQRQNLSPRYFSSVIKEKSGKTVLIWTIQMAMAESKQLLECSDLTIKEIATKLNFSTQSFFGKYFKQYSGLSPKEYRARFGSKSGNHQ